MMADRFRGATDLPSLDKEEEAGPRLEHRPRSELSQPAL